MDERRLERIERNLDKLLEQSLPRAEFQHQMTRLESRVGKALDRLGAAEGELRSLAAIEKRVDEHEGRLDDIEDVTIPVKHHEERRGMLLPIFVSAGSVLVNAFFTAVTFFAGGHTHHG